MDEFVVRGGLVYDGTGAPPAQADVWVRDGEIMAVGVDAGGSDIPAVDASGCVVTPGFVDIHRHCDAAPLRDADFGRVELAQGITCALAGNCGLAPVPLDVSRHGEFYEYIEPVVGKVPPHVCYNSYAGYVRALEQTELPLHLGFLAGIGAVRCAVKGFSAQPFTKRELEQAVALVDQAMEAGACGASLGIMYRPECYTAPSEYNALLRPVALRDGLLCTHIRGEGDSLVESVREVIGIARRAGVRLNISHFKATGVHNWRDKIFRAVECIEAARAQGQDVTADFYPYDGGSTTLLSLLPPTLAEYPPPFFAGHEGAARLREELYREHPGWDNMVTSIGWERILISSVEGAEYARYQGENFVRAAQMHGCGDPADLMAELIARAGGKVGIIVLSMAWEDVQAVARLPYTALISDALYGGGGNPHPRLYGAFPRMLRKLVREEGVLSFEQAVYKMTAMPAQRAHLSGRGVLRRDPAERGTDGGVRHLERRPGADSGEKVGPPPLEELAGLLALPAELAPHHHRELFQADYGLGGDPAHPQCAAGAGPGPEVVIHVEKGGPPMPMGGPLSLWEKPSCKKLRGPMGGTKSKPNAVDSIWNGGARERQNECAMSFAIEMKKLVASDMSLATSWRRRRDSNPRTV